MRVLQVSAEFFPLLKTGGLADVAGALPRALVAKGQDVRVLLPGFPQMLAGIQGLSPVAELRAPWGDLTQLLHGRFGELGVYLIDAPSLYQRPGDGPYEDAQRRPYADNHRRFALLGWAAAQLALGLDKGWQPELVHAHDWHAGLAPSYLAHADWHGRPRVRSLFTVHNLAYQGVFPAASFADLGLPPEAFHVNGLEYHGQVSFMKAGLFDADRLSTVSPTYAREIQTPVQGCGLDGLLRGRSSVLHGILNGVDDAVWNPATDALLAKTYSAHDMSGKARCKAALQKELGLAIAPDAPLFIVVCRLTGQKGLPLVLAGVEALLAQGGQLAVLGSGDAALEAAFSQRAAATPQSVSVRLGYDEGLAHRLFAGGDLTLVPSMFEPCGLTQLYGLRYGCLPLVHRVGGLADTVTDCTLEDLADDHATGFTFDEFSDAGYHRALRRAFVLYSRADDWRQVQACGMRQPADWATAAGRYAEAYCLALG